MYLQGGTKWWCRVCSYSVRAANLILETFYYVRVANLILETFYYVRAANLILETFYYVRAANLILDILCWLVHQPPLSILFSTNNRSVHYLVCTEFSHYFPSQPRDRLAIWSLLLSPCYFLFESSPRFMLRLSPLSSLFEPSPRFWMHEVALPLIILKI